MVATNSLTFYHKLDRVPFLKTMAMKVAFVAFIGVHLPLILSAVILLGFHSRMAVQEMILYLLSFTLIATGLTLFFLNKLVQPIRLMSQKLRLYISGEQWNYDTVEWRDENGRLSRDLDACIHNLEKTQEEKNDLYRLLSHDLKGMLATLQASLMMMEMDLSQEEGDRIEIRGKVELIERQILNVNSLLYYYSESGLEDYKVDVAPVNLYRMVSEVAALYNSALKMDRKTIETDIPQDVEIVTGRFLLRHLVFNLIDNAVKYSEKGSAIHISYKDGSLRVSNSKNKQTVFEINDWKKSTGLGMKIMHKTAEDLGFSLWMNDRENRYSVTLDLESKAVKRAS